mmetsp:Transcript_61499/g.133074  ORF Transcript_61499/g.133074 Transcript_61499/m.133074 type:complete len:251 (-) Transcript_61499:775-1527(-)
MFSLCKHSVREGRSHYCKRSIGTWRPGWMVAAGLASGRRVCRALPHERVAPGTTDELPRLVECPVLEGDDAPRGIGAAGPGLDHFGLGSQAVAKENRPRKGYLLKAEICNGGAVRRLQHRHPHEQRHGKHAVHKRSAKLGALRRLVVQVELRRIQRQSCEEQIVRLCDCAGERVRDYEALRQLVKPPPVMRPLWPVGCRGCAGCRCICWRWGSVQKALRLLEMRSVDHLALEEEGTRLAFGGFEELFGLS